MKKARFRGDGLAFTKLLYGDENTKNIATPPNKSKYKQSFSPLRQDARTLHLLKKECQRTGAGSETFTRVFNGLLSIHSRNLNAFLDALRKESGHG